MASQPTHQQFTVVSHNRPIEYKIRKSLVRDLSTSEKEKLSMNLSKRKLVELSRRTDVKAMKLTDFQVIVVPHWWRSSSTNST